MKTVNSLSRRDFHTTPITEATRSPSPEGWLKLLGWSTTEEILTTLQCLDQPAINLDEQELLLDHVDKLAAVLRDGRCPPLELSLRAAKAVTFRRVLEAAQQHLPLTRLDLSWLRIHAQSRQGRPCTIPSSYLGEIAVLLKPGSKLAELNLGGQVLTSTDHRSGVDHEEPYMSDPMERQATKEALGAMLVAVRESDSMKKLNLSDCRLFAEDLPLIGRALFPGTADDTRCGLTELLLARQANGEEPRLERLAGAADETAVGAFVDQVMRGGGFDTLQTLDLGGRETNCIVQGRRGLNLTVEAPSIRVGMEVLIAQEPAPSLQVGQVAGDAKEAKRREAFDAEIQLRKRELAEMREAARRARQPNEQPVVLAEKKNA